MNVKQSISLLFFLANTLVVFGQPGGFGGFGNVGRGGGGASIGQLTLDTSDIYYFYADNPKLVFPFEDSLLNGFQQYDPTIFAHN